MCKATRTKSHPNRPAVRKPLDIGPHYAKTLSLRRGNLFSSIGRVRALGLSEAFIRMWEFYLCYCEAGFTERAWAACRCCSPSPTRGRTA